MVGGGCIGSGVLTAFAVTFAEGICLLLRVAVSTTFVVGDDAMVGFAVVVGKIWLIEAGVAGGSVGNIAAWVASVCAIVTRSVGAAVGVPGSPAEGISA